MGINKTNLALVLLFGLLGYLLLYPAVQKVRDDPGYRRSAASLKRIGDALLAYHDAYRKLPPAVVTDKAGRPLYSWRVALLPFLEERKLYQEFRLDEPWDSPHNKRLAEETPYCYVPALGGGDDGPGLTRYQVFVGPGTAFERPLALRTFTDEPADTILAVEAREPVPWSKPADLSYHPRRPLPALGGLFSKPVERWWGGTGSVEGFNAVFADGTVRFIWGDTGEGTIRAFITRNGGEPVKASSLD